MNWLKNTLREWLGIDSLECRICAMSAVERIIQEPVTKPKHTTIKKICKAVHKVSKDKK